MAGILDGARDAPRWLGWRAMPEVKLEGCATASPSSPWTPPERRNALTVAMAEELVAACEDIDADDDGGRGRGVGEGG